MLGDELSSDLRTLCLVGALFSYLGLVYSLARYTGAFFDEENSPHR